MPAQPASTTVPCSQGPLPGSSPAPDSTGQDPLTEAFAAFLEEHPSFSQTSRLDEERSQEFARLDQDGHVYLDYTGGGLYSDRQLRRHSELLRRGVFGNPHSHNPSSEAATDLCERARDAVRRYFNAPDNYCIIFTANASGALKLVGESYPFAAGTRYLLTSDNHNSVNGIREFARRRGATFCYAPLRPDLRLDQERLLAELDKADADADHLFAFPAQSNFTGVQHPLSLIEQAQERGWDVLLDAAAFVPTNRLDLQRWQPDFVCLSFYKMFGYPTGVGALLARKETMAKLTRPWFAGGTVRVASVGADIHYLWEEEAGFEDGTVDYLNIPAVEIGLDYLDEMGVDVIHDRVMALTDWLLRRLCQLRHDNGQPMVLLYGPSDCTHRGATMALNLLDAAGEIVDPERVAAEAGRQNISLRTGCFCNPGAGEAAKKISEEAMSEVLNHPGPLDFNLVRKAMKATYDVEISSLRISFGIASNFADAYRFLDFIQTRGRALASDAAA